MQVKPTKMGQWPPSPSVEDEDKALANEHSIDATIQSLKSDDQPAQDRGSIDQYPIIIDSPIQERSREVEPGQSAKCTTHDKAAGDGGSSDDSAGPPTPPPLVRKDEKRRRPTPNVNSIEATQQSYAHGSSILPERQAPTRGRPQITRIQTDVGGDVRAMATGNRRPPSPYSYTRSPTVQDPTIAQIAAADNLLSPIHALSSPGPFHPAERQAPVNLSQPSDRSILFAVGNSNPTIRHDYSEGRHPGDLAGRRIGRDPDFHAPAQVKPKLPRSQTVNDVRHSYYDLPPREPLDPGLLSPPRSRRESKVSTFDSSGEERPGKTRPVYSTRRPRDLKDSPYTSSAEESPRQHRHRAGHSSSDEQRKLRRRSSHRRERPSFTELGFHRPVESTATSAVGKPEAKTYRHDPRDRGHQYLTTPTAGDISQAADENYFVEAFRQNERKRYNPDGTRSSGSTRVSPFSSPPRTPKSERQSRDYFDLTQITERPVQRSRPPSTEQIPSRDSKTYSSLSSAVMAGAAGAAVASRVSGPSKRTSIPSAEASPVVSSRVFDPPRSARPSLVPNDDPSHLPRNILHSPVEAQHSFRNSLAPSHDLGPVSRGSINNMEPAHTHAPSHPHPHRALSYSGPDHSHLWNSQHSASVASPINTVNSPDPSHIYATPQPRSARTSINGPEGLLSTRQPFNLPVCPRPQPLSGHRDWYTIKEMSELDICPTCVSAMATTKYQNLLVPSVPRPYNEPSVCAMSRPWLRIAFLQSVRQNRPDLTWMQVVTSMPKDIRPCAGNKRDIKKWFHVIDPQTRDPVPGFFACAACVRSVDIVFPNMYQVFERPRSALSQERSCSLHAASKFFHSIIDELEHMSLRCKGRPWRSADIEPLIKLLNRVARYRPCPQRELQLTRAWHYMPEFPELTICEECYDDIVWPIHDRPIAQNITKTLKVVPVRRGSAASSGIGCQLYSDRMRKIFREAVSDRNFAMLRDAVRSRIIAQHRFIDTQRLLEADMKRGTDRRKEMERNYDIWRGHE